MNAIETIILSLLTSGFASAAIIWLAKNVISERIKNAIKHEYDAKLETHKAQLKSESDVSVERLKAQLHIAAAERNIRFTKAFEELAETVAETYRLLLALNDAVTSYVNPVEFQGGPTKADRRKTVGEKMSAFRAYYRPRRLYLPLATAHKIDDLQNKLHSTAIDFMFGVEEGGDDRRMRRDFKANEEIDTWTKTHEFVSKEVPVILMLLEEDFRRLLGTTEDERQNDHSSVIRAHP